MWLYWVGKRKKFIISYQQLWGGISNSLHHGAWCSWWGVRLLLWSKLLCWCVLSRNKGIYPWFENNKICWLCCVVCGGNGTWKVIGERREYKWEVVENKRRCNWLGDLLFLRSNVRESIWPSWWERRVVTIKLVLDLVGSSAFHVPSLLFALPSPSLTFFLFPPLPIFLLYSHFHL